MKYTQHIVIDRPVEQVVSLFNEPENLKRWHPDLVSIELLSGEERQTGAKTRLLYSTTRGDFELIETITNTDLLNDLSGEYDTVGKGMFNTMSNRFSSAGQGKTRYEIEIDYQFSGVIMRSMGLTMGWMFKKQSYKSLERFKAFVEGESDSSESAEQSV